MGLDTFFKPEREIFISRSGISRSGGETLRILKEVTEEARRARELEACVQEVTETPSRWRGMNGNARFADPAADPIA